MAVSGEAIIKGYQNIHNIHTMGAAACYNHPRRSKNFKFTASESVVDSPGESRSLGST
jgi:hypothetical protein